jgi:septum formation protein
MNEIVLASSSPRRRAIMRQMGLAFISRDPDIDESDDATLSSEEFTKMIAYRKIRSVQRRYPELANHLVVGADTVIEFAGRRYGKPAGRHEAMSFLRAFSGAAHTVISGIALSLPAREAVETAAVSSLVRFAPLSEGEIDWYLDTGEWKGAAGAYRIQERGACLIDDLAGSYSGVMGLPIRQLYHMLRQNGYLNRSTPDQ